MATGVKQFQIDITTNPGVILQTAEPVASNVTSPIPLSGVLAVTPIYYNFRPVSGPVASLITSYAVSPYRITIPGIYSTEQIVAGDTIDVSGSTAVPVTKVVTGYFTAPEKIKFAGVFTPFITAGMLFTITGSTSNDGVYTAISATDDGTNTTVTVAETINPAVVDGNVTFTPLNNNGTYTVASIAISGGNTVVTVVEPITSSATGGTATFTPHGNVENNDTGNQFGETYPYPTMTKLRFSLHDGLSHEIELQSITNQATWSTGTLLALQTAAAAINALIP